MKRVGLLRVSTTAADGGQDVDSQRLAISTWAARENVTVEFVEENGVHGDSAERPILDALVASLEPGDVLIVTALDRLSRDVVRCVQTLDRLTKKGVRLLSLTEQFDFHGPMGRVMAGMLGLFSEMFLVNLRAKTRGGMKTAKANGRIVGQIPYRWLAETDAALLARTNAGERVENFAHELVAVPQIAIDDRGEDVSKSGRKGVGTRDGIGRAPSANAARRRLKRLLKQRAETSPSSP